MAENGVSELGLVLLLTLDILWVRPHSQHAELISTRDDSGH